MPDLGPHAFFIIASYGFTAVVLAALVAWAFDFERRQARLQRELEEQGYTRRGRSGAEF